MGYTVTFFHVDSKSIFKKFMSIIFYKQNLPLPVIYTVNGTIIAGIADGGAKEKDLQTAVQKEFDKLPVEFQQAMREFYLFCDKSTPGLLVLSAYLSNIFGKEMDSYSGCP